MTVASYCDRHLYMFSFVYALCTLVIIGLHLVLFCCICTCMTALQCYMWSGKNNCKKIRPFSKKPVFH